MSWILEWICQSSTGYQIIYINIYLHSKSNQSETPCLLQILEQLSGVAYPRIPSLFFSESFRNQEFFTVKS